MYASRWGSCFWGRLSLFRLLTCLTSHVLVWRHHRRWGKERIRWMSCSRSLGQIPLPARSRRGRLVAAVTRDSDFRFRTVTWRGSESDHEIHELIILQEKNRFDLDRVQRNDDVTWCLLLTMMKAWASLSSTPMMCVITTNVALIGLTKCDVMSLKLCPTFVRILSNDTRVLLLTGPKRCERTTEKATCSQNRALWCIIFQENDFCLFYTWASRWPSPSPLSPFIPGGPGSPRSPLGPVFPGAPTFPMFPTKPRFPRRPSFPGRPGGPISPTISSSLLGHSYCLYAACVRWANKLHEASW